MGSNPLWVFGYGSLMWNPGFCHAERRLARLDGFRRSFCMRSIHHRGTTEAPGLVLGLDAVPSAECTGIAFRVDNTKVEATLDYLRARELVSSAYLETIQHVRLRDGPDVDLEVEALTFIVDHAHVQYCGDFALEEQARIIARAVGERGPNTEYLWNTAAHLRELGIADDDLQWLARRVHALTRITTS